MTTWPLDNTLYTAQAIGAFSGTRTRGVFCSDDCFRVSADGEFSVRVQPGLAWLKKEDFWGVAVLETAPTVLEIEVGSGLLQRYAAVVLQLDKTANKSHILVKYGEYGYTKPQPVRDEFYDEIILAYCLQKAGAVAITNGDIQDTRTDESVCGLMRDGVTGLPTSQFHAQAEQFIQELKDSIADTLAGSVPDNIFTTEKIANGAVTTEKFASSATAPNSAKLGGKVENQLNVSSAASATKASNSTKWSDMEFDWNESGAWPYLLTQASNADKRVRRVETGYFATAAKAAELQQGISQNYTIASRADSTANSAKSIASAAMPKTGGGFNGAISASDGHENTSPVSVGGIGGVGIAHINGHGLALLCGGGSATVYNGATSAYAPIQASAFVQLSTAEAKNTVSEMTEQEAQKFLQLAPKKYKYNNENTRLSEYHYGFIAEEVAQIDTTTIYYNSDGEAGGINYGGMIAPLLKLLQMQDTAIKALTTRIEALEKKA